MHKAQLTEETDFMTYSFESWMHCDIWIGSLNVYFSSSVTIYLDGATPTKFGPSPLKSDLGPSFSRIDLKIKTKRKKENSIWVKSYTSVRHSEELYKTNEH